MAGHASNFGMMSDAFFVGKRVLVEWVNEFLSMNIMKVEQCADGAIYCHLLDALFPGSVSMKKVDFNFKNEYEYVKNWKIVQEVFHRQDIPKKIPIDRLIQARFQDNLEFLQWFYHFFNQLYDGSEYDAPARRQRSKGGKAMGAGVAKKQKRNQPKRITAGNRRDPKIRKLEKSRQQTGTGSRAPPVTSAKQPRTQMLKQPRAQIAQQPSNSNANKFRAEFEQMQVEVKTISDKNATLTKTLQDLQKDYKETENMAQLIERERDFYFQKVVKVEELVKKFQEENGEQQFSKNLLEVLYATDDVVNDEDLLDIEEMACENLVESEI